MAQALEKELSEDEWSGDFEEGEGGVHAIDGAVVNLVGQDGDVVFAGEGQEAFGLVAGIIQPVGLPGRRGR
jgi:hypothetical protein